MPIGAVRADAAHRDHSRDAAGGGAACRRPIRFRRLLRCAARSPAAGAGTRRKRHHGSADPRAPRGRRCSWCSSPSIATEGVAWVAAERFRHSLERHRRASTGRDASELRGHPGAEHARHRAAACASTGCCVHRLVAMADRVIADYRREEPTMAAAGVAAGAAGASLGGTARRRAINDSRRSSLTCDAHVIRLAARTQSASAARDGPIAEQSSGSRPPPISRRLVIRSRISGISRIAGLRSRRRRPGG